MHLKKSEILTTKAKALEINLQSPFYGTIAEIGAGQEVASMFFKAGVASATVAKTISAYDMTFSNAIYGKEQSGRYVVKSRLEKMLACEYDLLNTRLSGVRAEKVQFFAFANTVATKGTGNRGSGHGWMGVRFQCRPGGPANDLIVHVNMLDKDNLSQQEALGIAGVNLIYACHKYGSDLQSLVFSLGDNLSLERLEFDMISLTGEDFRHVDNRVLGLRLVEYGLAQVAMFDPQGNVVQPSEVLYKKPILAVRGSFRPPTLVNADMLEAGLKQFEEERGTQDQAIVPLCEITLHTLSSQAKLDTQDFLARADLLGALGHYVLISNYELYYQLSQYFARFTDQRVVMGLGIDRLGALFNESIFSHLDGGLLESMGKLFSRNTKLYVYPMRNEAQQDFITCENFEPTPHQRALYQYLKENGFITSYKYANSNLHHIYSNNVLQMIQDSSGQWESMVPESVVRAVKSKALFGYR